MAPIDIHAINTRKQGVTMCIHVYLHSAGSGIGDAFHSMSVICKHDQRL